MRMLPRGARSAPRTSLSPVARLIAGRSDCSKTTRSSSRMRSAPPLHLRQVACAMPKPSASSLVSVVRMAGHSRRWSGHLAIARRVPPDFATP
jgi:hypothetical protein